MRNNPNLDLVMVNAYAKSDQISSIGSQDIEHKRNFENTKGHNSVENLQTLTRKNPNLDLIMVNAYPKFGRIPSIRLQDIEQKQNFANYQGP